jgi:hypothetical protein
MEGLSLSRIISAEGERIRYALGTLPGIAGFEANTDDVVLIGESVRSVIQAATTYNESLRKKLETVLTPAAQPPNEDNGLVLTAIAELSHDIADIPEQVLSDLGGDMSRLAGMITAGLGESLRELPNSVLSGLLTSLPDEIASSLSEKLQNCNLQRKE